MFNNLNFSRKDLSLILILSIYLFNHLEAYQDEIFFQLEFILKK
jgi:hypothetical protein